MDTLPSLRFIYFYCIQDSQMIPMRKQLICLCICVLTYISSHCQLVAAHNLSPADYQKKFDELAAQGYGLADVSGYALHGKETYAAIWNKAAGPGSIARHGLSEAGYQTTVTEFKTKGLRPGRISAYNIAGHLKFACIFYKSNLAWIARHDLSSQAYQQEYNAHTANGYKLVEVCGYNKGGLEKYAAVWEKKSTVQQPMARHAMSGQQYQAAFNELWSKGYRPIRISGFEVNGQARYAGMWQQVKDRVYARFGLSNNNYQAEVDNQYYQGGSLQQVSAYSVQGIPYFAAIWQGAALAWNDIETIDSKVKTYMEGYKVPGLSLAVMNKGRLVFAKGYGVANKSTGDLVSPNSLFRIASVSKPITATAIMKLVENKKLKLTDKVFGATGILGDVCVTTNECIDKDDAAKITVQQCLEHATGFTQDAIWEHNELDNAALLKWALKNYACTNAPGAKFQYMNFDYFLLARIIEKVTGQTYEQYVKQKILSPCGISLMRIGANAQSDKAPNEVTYYEGNPYGLNIKRMDGNGGWIARPIDLLMFMSGVDREPNRKDLLAKATMDTMLTASKATGANGYAKGWIADGNAWMHNGCMNGTLAHLKHYKNGISVAIIINTRPATDDCHWNGMYPLAESIAEGKIKWPLYNLF